MFVAKGGRSFVLLAAAAAIVALAFEVYASAAFLALTVFLVFIFRDPERDAGEGIVAPADGTVREVDEGRGLVSAYLSLANVHVTRAPISGSVVETSYMPGTHTPAFSDGTPNNERLEIRLGTEMGGVIVIEMAGAIARRIVPYVKQGDVVQKGTRLSLIRFGSRVDLYLPPGRTRIIAQKGQKLRAGVTMIAEVLDGSIE